MPRVAFPPSLQIPPNMNISHRSLWNAALGAWVA
ncbi:MAG: hypothetical protein EON92_20525, partial [Burkholderiales bacterium]